MDGSYHSVDSSDMAFRTAARVGMSEALAQAESVLLEPVLAVTIYTPSEAMSRATGIVSGRRGQILGFGPRVGWEGWERLEALIPEAEMDNLIVELRSATSGAGFYEARFDHLAEVTGRHAREVTAAQRQGQRGRVRGSAIWALPFDLGKARSRCSFAKGPLFRQRSFPSRAPVAQLDRAPDYEFGGQRFESFRARHLIPWNSGRYAVRRQARRPRFVPVSPICHQPARFHSPLPFGIIPATS